MVQFKTNATLQKHLTSKISSSSTNNYITNGNGAQIELSFNDKEILKSPAEKSQIRAADRVRIPLVYNYKQSAYQSQSNSECPSRKTKQRVRLEEGGDANKGAGVKYQSSLVKKSFEDGSPVSNKHPLCIYKENCKQERQVKPHRPSIGQGSSPQASSSSSIYCFSSNRSSNVSTKQQILPESLNNKISKVKKKQQQGMVYSKLQNPTKVSQSFQPSNKSNSQNKMSVQRQNQSPTQIQQLQRFNIADEKINLYQRQAIAETPKFNDYYSLISKKQPNLGKKTANQDLRSKSLIKSQIVNSQTGNEKEMGSDNNNVKITIIERKERPIFQSHSSCSQHEDLLAYDKNIEQNKNYRQKSNKVIKIKKSNIKFSKKRENQSPQIEKPIQQTNKSLRKDQHPFQKPLKHISIESGSFNIQQKFLKCGIMIGSPKIQQKQQQAKEEVEASIISSQTSFLSDFDDKEDNIKISYIKNEQKINQIAFSKEGEARAINHTYNQYLQNDDIHKSRKSILRKQKSDIKEKTILERGGLFKQVVNPTNSLHLKRSLDQEQLKRQSDQIQTLLFDGAIHSAGTTYREFPLNQNLISSTSSGLQDDQKRSAKKILHFSNAKQEFMELSLAMRTFDTRADNQSQQQTIIQETFQTFDRTQKFDEKIRKHNQAQLSIAMLRNSLKSIQSTIAIEGSLGQCKNSTKISLGHNFLTYVLTIDDISYQLIQLLSLEEMCKLLILLSSKKHYGIKLCLAKQLNRYLIRQNNYQKIIQFWKNTFMNRLINIRQSSYYLNLTQQRSNYDFEIEKDIERTFPHDSYFSKTQINQQKMLRILRAVSFHLPHIGYVQGFNFIVANLIKLLRNEEQVFWMFISLLKWKNIQNLYSEGMPYLKLIQFQLNCFVQNLLPEVELFLSKHNILPEYFTSQWILTLFSIDFDLDFFTIFLNQMLLFGPQFIIQISLSLISYIQEDLLKLKSMEEAMEFLKEFTHRRKFPTLLIFDKAVEFTQVNSQRLRELELIFRRSKNKKRVLFVKDHDQDITYIKTLPNLPDEEVTTECNVEEEPSDDEKEEDDYSPSVNAVKKKQINNSFYLNNVSSMDIRSNSGLDSEKGLKPNSRLQLYQELSVDDRKVQLILEESEHDHSVIDQNIEENQYFSTESQDRALKTKLFSLMPNNFSQGQNPLKDQKKDSLIIEGISDSTPAYSYQKLFANTKFKTNQSNQNLKSDLKNTQAINHEQSSKKVPEEILDKIFKRRVMHSPSLDNLKSSFQVTKNRKSKPSLLYTPNSEDVIESERKPFEKIKNPYIEQVISNMGKLDNAENINDDTINSHNISNIEEFINELDFQSLHDKFQNTQRLTTRKENREDLTERDTFSWTKSKPFARELQLQFEISKLGSHLNTPNFQHTNRSQTILQENKINNPINSFEKKKSALNFKNNARTSENQDPNKLSTGRKQSQPSKEINLIRNSLMFKLKSSTDDFQQMKISSSSKPINNFQRFSATQQNPLQKGLSKQQDKLQNKIVHNWSANDHSNQIEFVNSSRNNTQNIEEVIRSMKSPSIAPHLQIARSSRILNQKSIQQSQNNRISLTHRGEGSLSHRSIIPVRNNKFNLQVTYNLENIPALSNQIMSPRTTAYNKQSQKLLVHKGDNYNDESETTTILSPKESFYGVFSKINNKN